MKNKIIYIISLVTILIDQIIKLLVTTKLEIAKEIKIIPKLLSIYYVENEGAAFSILEGKTIFLILISIICIGLIISLIYKEKSNNKLVTISLGLLLGGIIGNLIDRLFRNVVVDYILVYIFSYKFPVFNIADMCITCSIFIYFIISFYEEYVIIRKNKGGDTK